MVLMPWIGWEFLNFEIVLIYKFISKPNPPDSPRFSRRYPILQHGPSISAVDFSGEGNSIDLSQSP